MKLAFMGSPGFSVPSLMALVSAGHQVAAVYCQPAKPAGRGKALRPCPVEVAARELGLEVRTPKTLKDPEVQQAFADLDLDAAVVVAYGKILPKTILDMPKYGCLNVHASLLPRWRGAAPIHRALMAGDTQTGVQIMQMEEGLDTGPILLSEAIDITPQDTTGSLHDTLAHLGAKLLPPALSALERGSLVPTPQAEEGVTYANKIDKAEAQIDWSQPAQQVDGHIRGLSPFPGAWFDHKGTRIKVLMSEVTTGAGAPGTVLDDGLTIACGDGAVRLRTLQRAGKAPQDAETFLRGYGIAKGETLV